MTAAFPLTTLKRLLDADVPAPGSACRRCGAMLPDDHPHLADIESRALECVCATCHADASSRSRDATIRPVPRRYARASDTILTDDRWNAFDIPVGIAFVFHNSAMRRLVVSYPGPAGATESLLPTSGWERVLPEIAPDVEALLVRRTRGARDCFIVPIDACYELAGRIRRTWSGFSGGSAAHDEIETFFERVRERCRGTAP